MEISKRTLGVVAAVGIVAGAAGAFVATHVGTPAQTAPAGFESTAPAVPTPASDTLATSVAGTVEQPARVEPRPATVPGGTVPARPRESDRAPVVPTPTAPGVPAETGTRADAAAPQIAPGAPVATEAGPPADREPGVVAAIEEPRFEDLVLPAQSVLGIQLERTVSSETAVVEDEVIARVTRDVRVGDRVAIPAGARATGFVTLVERGGRLKERARLGLRFTSVTLADGTRVPVVTEAIYREGDSPRNESAAKIGGGAIGGAIIGGILGGGKGAAIGGSIGAGAGSAAVLTGGRNAATLPAGSPITVRLENAATVTVER